MRKSRELSPVLFPYLCRDPAPMAVIPSAEANTNIKMIIRDLPCRSSVIQTFRSRPVGRKLCLFACHEEHNAANERHRTKDGRQRNGVCLFTRSVNWSDVDDLFPGCVRKTAPRKTEQTKYHQDNPKRFVHGGLLWRRWLKTVTENLTFISKWSYVHCASEPV